MIGYVVLAIAGIILSIIMFIFGIYMGNSKFIGKLKITKDEIDDEIKNAKIEAVKVKEKALEEAVSIKKKEMKEAREEIDKMQSSLDKEIKSQKEQIKLTEERLIKKEENIDRKEQNIEKIREKLETEKTEIEKINSDLKQKLYEIANLTQEEAKTQVLNETKEKYELDIAQKYKEIKDNYEEDAKKYAKWVITTAIQRYASDVTAEITTSTVILPTDDMKGRIIGREGRNIRTFEKLTGADLIIDDTPELVVLSCFNPLRREIAKKTLDLLVADGRIHPARIEEMYEKTKKETEEHIKEAGKEAVMRVGIKQPHPELVKLLGRLKYRTSYGQDVLEHSIEVAQFAGLMAAELGLNEEIAKRSALFHDLGKAIDHEVEGSHAIVGGQIAKRYGEKPEVVNGMQVHHNEVDAICPEAVLVGAADALSAARPGARREALENYVRRIEQNLSDM